MPRSRIADVGSSDRRHAPESKPRNNNLIRLFAQEFSYSQSKGYSIFSAILNRISRLLERLQSFNGARALRAKTLTQQHISVVVQLAARSLTLDGLSRLPDEEKIILARQIENLLFCYKAYFTGVGCADCSILISMLTKLTTTKNANEIVQILQHSSFDPQKIISKNFSNRYFEFLKKDRKIRGEVTKNLQNYMTELSKKTNPEEKLEYLDTLPKEIKTLLGHYHASQLSIGERLHILTERITIICDTMRNSTATPKYTDYFEWNQWLSGHVGVRAVKKDKREQYFSVLIDAPLDGLNKFKKLSPIFVYDFDIDENAQGHEVFTRYTLPFAGSEVLENGEYQYFGLSFDEVINEMNTFRDDNSKLHHRNTVYYKYYSEYHNCVGSVQHIINHGGGRLFTEVKFSHTFSPDVADPRFSLAYLYSINTEIRSINKKCRALAEKFACNRLDLSDLNKSEDLLTNTRPSIQELRGVFSAYQQAKDSGRKLRQLRLLKQMVEESYTHLNNEEFCENEQNKAFITMLLTEIQVVYASKTLENNYLGGDEYLERGIILSQRYNKIGDVWQQLVKECPNKLSVVFNVLKTLYGSSSDKLLEALLGPNFAQNKDQSSLGEALAKKYPNQGILIRNVLQTLYFNEPEKFVEALNSTKLWDENNVLSLIDHYYWGSINLRIRALKIFYGAHSELLLRKIIDNYKNIPSLLVDAVKFFYADDLDAAVMFFYGSAPKLFAQALKRLYADTSDVVLAILQHSYECDPNLYAEALKEFYANNPDAASIILKQSYEKTPRLYTRALKRFYADHLDELFKKLKQIYEKEPSLYAEALKEFYADTPDEGLKILKQNYEHDPSLYAKALKEFYSDNSSEALAVLQHSYGKELKLYIKAVKVFYASNVAAALAFFTRHYSTSPQLFVKILKEFYADNPDEVLIVLLQNYEKYPSLYAEALKEFYADTPDESLKILKQNYERDPRLYARALKGFYSDNLDEALKVLCQCYEKELNLYIQALKELYSEDLGKTFVAVKNHYGSDNFNLLVQALKLLYDKNPEKLVNELIKIGENKENIL